MSPLPRAAVAARVRWCAAAIVVLALLAYGAALAGDYVFDDIHSVWGNPALHDPGNIASYWTDPAAFTRGNGRMYRPVLLTTFALNWAISPAAWCLKLGNLLVHAAVAVLLFTWLWRLSRRLVAASVIAALFAVHPLASEAVNLVSARSELLSTAGLLVGLLAHLGWQRSGGGLLAHLGMLAGAVLACGSKENGVMLPVLCAVQACCRRHALPGRRDWARTLVGLLPMLGVVVAYLVARKLLLGEIAVPLLDRTGDDPASGHGRSLAMQLATMGTLLPKALLQAVMPVGLSLDPPVHFRASFLDPWVLLGWGSLAGLTVAAAWPGPTARLRRIGTALAWLVAAPWIVVPLNQPFAEHRLYAPLVGFAAIVCAVAPRRWPVRMPVRVPVRVLQMVGVAVVLLGMLGSAERSLLYRDERALWRVQLAQHATSWRAWWGLGTATLRAGDAAGAIEPLANAHALYPTQFDVHSNYAEALVSLPDAVAQPHRALVVAAQLAALSPGDAWVRTLHARACLQAGRVLGDRDAFVKAEELALSCLQIATPKGYVYRLAAFARCGLGDLEGALAHLDTSIARGLAHTEVRLHRAAVLRELGRAADAQRELLTAQREAPTDPAVMSALFQLGASPR